MPIKQANDIHTRPRLVSAPCKVWLLVEMEELGEFDIGGCGRIERAVQTCSDVLRQHGIDVLDHKEEK